MLTFTVLGLGYVGLSLATLISQEYEVIAFDIDENKISKLLKKESPITDKYIESYLREKELNMIPTSDKNVAYNNRDYYIIATPTDYNEDTDSFDVSSIEAVMEQIAKRDPKANVVIKSTIPIFYTEQLMERYPDINIIFSPEFLREGKALYDNLYPSRIIVSPKNEAANTFGKILQKQSLNKDVEMIMMGTTEAEAVKLFSNTYLAMRVAFFNELDTFAETNHLKSGEIINGVSLDPRVGDFYNNPSFGYGGYCLPKDTKQLKANFKDIPSSIIHSVIESNDQRKEFIAQQVLNKKPKSVGIYKLAMKAGSDNFRSSSIVDVMHKISNENIPVIIYDESLIGTETYNGFKVSQNLSDFKSNADVIITNRMDEELESVEEKVYTRDVFGEN